VGCGDLVSCEDIDDVAASQDDDGVIVVPKFSVRLLGHE
jgi:hypothetical protein